MLYLEMRDWNVVRAKVVDENLLRARTQSTLKRICREVIPRLRMLEFDEIAMFVKCGPQEQGYLLWLAVCRRHRFIAEFAEEVLQERYLGLKSDISSEDFDAFFNAKSTLHPELDKIRPTTRSKLRQVLFRMLREAELLDPKNRIRPVMPSASFVKAISPDRRSELRWLPILKSVYQE